MGSRPKNSNSLQMARAKRKSSNEKRPKNPVDSGENYSSISEKLEALKQLLPSKNDELKADDLFEETADYIVLLRTQIFVLQKLLHFYENASARSQDNHV
ncbi:hypothetical protein P3S67_022983 [Capsicum chacoense]